MLGIYLFFESTDVEFDPSVLYLSYFLACIPPRVVRFFDLLHTLALLVICVLFTKSGGNLLFLGSTFTPCLLFSVIL